MASISTLPSSEGANEGGKKWWWCPLSGDEESIAVVVVSIMIHTHRVCSVQYRVVHCRQLVLMQYGDVMSMAMASSRSK